MLWSPIPYQGGKRREVKIIEKYQPEEFDKVIDAFGGGGSVALFYEQSYVLDKVIYNDIFPQLPQLFKFLQSEDKTRELQQQIRALPKTHTEYTRIHNKGLDNLTSAEFYFKARLSMRGLLNSANPRKMRKGKGVTYAEDEIDTIPESMLNGLSAYPDVFKHIEIQNKSALELIEEYKNDEYTFIYCDPPYLTYGIDNSSYSHCKVDDILKIGEMMKDKKYKCKIMLHIDFSGWLQENFKDRIKFIYPTNYTSRFNRKNASVMKDYQAIVCNY